jgi:hypothetical protein
MFFVVFIGGILLVRFLAFLLSPDRGIPKVFRILISLSIGVGLGLLPLALVDNLLIFTEGKGAIMTILNGLGIIPAIMGVGTSLVLVSVAAEGEGSSFIELFSDDRYRYGYETGPLPLIAMIGFAVFLSGLVYLLIYGFSLTFAMVLYFIVQFIGFIKAVKGDK